MSYGIQDISKTYKNKKTQSYFSLRLLNFCNYTAWRKATGKGD